MFGVEDSSREVDQEPIYFDADADDIAVLFDILSIPLGYSCSLARQPISIGRCVVLLALADTYSFCRVRSVVEEAMVHHLTKYPFQVLKVASALKEVELGRRAILSIADHKHSHDINYFFNCWGHPCRCEILWKSFDDVGHLWRAELALAIVQTMSRAAEVPSPSDMGLPWIACWVLRKVAESFGPG
jgi:hypothetical protein